MTDLPVALVVDDDATNRMVLTRSLEKEGLRVVAAEDGLVALDLLLRETFDLVLLDIEMPNVNGLEVLRQVKRDDNLRHVPIVVISGSEEAASAVQSIELGAEDYLTKPFNPALLRARVNASLARKRLHDLELEHQQLLKTLFDRHVGEEVARHAIAHPGADLGGSTREASALMVDVIGSTALALRLEPEDVVAALNGFFDAVVATVMRHGGWVNKFIGDAALCVFGAPDDQPDHATRALRAARELRDELDRRSESLNGLDTGIGLSSGTLVAGYVGAANRFEYTVIGDPVNEAARLADEAKHFEQRLLASGPTIGRAEREEQRVWAVEAKLELRGRDEPTLAFTARG